MTAVAGPTQRQWNQTATYVRVATARSCGGAHGQMRFTSPAVSDYTHAATPQNGDPPPGMGHSSHEFEPDALRRGFTLIELLVVVAIIGLLISILLPTLAATRAQARATKCLAQLRVLGQGLVLYNTEERGRMVPGRLPRVDNCNWAADLPGGRKYRPTFLPMMTLQVGIPAFDDPQPCRGGTDRFGQPGDMQNYASPIFVCPETADWTDERNGSYGYNYQFLGNSRLSNSADIYSFKNWPVMVESLAYPARTVAVADSMGTAASWPRHLRQEYLDNSRDADRYGNEGFNLDPPWVDPVDGEMAGMTDSPPHRSAAHDRHADKANVVWVDGHGEARTLKSLGYEQAEDGSISFEGENTLWTGDGRDVPWTPQFRQGGP